MLAMASMTFTVGAPWAGRPAAAPPTIAQKAAPHRGRAWTGQQEGRVDFGWTGTTIWCPLSVDRDRRAREVHLLAYLVEKG
jgi:hypothetical protein